MSFQLIETKTLGSSATSIEFTSIPQTYTDLLLLFSVRSDGTNHTLWVQFNGVTTGYTSRRLGGTGSGIESSSSTEAYFAYSNGSGQTANTFGSTSLYIANYTSSVIKTVISDSINENNATAAESFINTGLWNNTAAITSVKIDPVGDPNLVAGSTISLYGILKGSSGGVVVS